jgi:adenine-specific DNA-methyltransferase
VPRNNDLDLRFILALLNSSFLNWYYQTIINPEKGEALAQVKRGHLAQIPIRRINFDDAADKARHDRMVKFVEQMLSLKQQHAAAEAALSDQRHIMAEQIERTDKAIDALVYELYGLTEDEIRIVEGT